MYYEEKTQTFSIAVFQIISHYQGNSDFSCSRWSDHKLHPTLEKLLHNESKKPPQKKKKKQEEKERLLAGMFSHHKIHKINKSAVWWFSVGKHFLFSWLRISHSFPRLPEIWVQRWKHRVLAGMRRLQVGLSGWPSLESWADLSEVHPASSLQGGQFMKSFWGQDSTLLACCGWWLWPPTAMFCFSRCNEIFCYTWVDIGRKKNVSVMLLLKEEDVNSIPSFQPFLNSFCCFVSYVQYSCLHATCVYDYDRASKFWRDVSMMYHNRVLANPDPDGVWTLTVASHD